MTHDFCLKLASQVEKILKDIWTTATSGQYTGSSKISNTDAVFAKIQTLSKNLSEFKPKNFDYIIIDELHHADAKSYKNILGYFKPKFILGLSATPEHMDGEDMLELFQNVARKMDLESKLFVLERNKLIVVTYLKFVNGRKTVIFCASVNHATEIAKLLRKKGVNAEAISGKDKTQARNEVLKEYEYGKTNVLCMGF